MHSFVGYGSIREPYPRAENTLLPVFLSLGHRVPHTQQAIKASLRQAVDLGWADKHYFFALPSEDESIAMHHIVKQQMKHM